MEFESPDVERDFPGLFSSESARKNNDSDFSDESHEKLSKKDLLIGKKKDKKDSKKDRGYAALEGESSPEEEVDVKSPTKSKKSKAFKFPSSKKLEKREKSREKDLKEKEVEKEKKKDKKEKEKLKVKEKKKKHGDEVADIAEEQPLFGVPLETVVQWAGCHDGVAIPLVLRNCIDFIHSSGLTMESLYKISGVKSKIHTLRKLYNQREPVTQNMFDVPTATSLLKIFLRELPEPLLTDELLARFEEAGAIKEVGAREVELQKLINQLPLCNQVTLGWLIVHFDHVTLYEKQNKINAQSVAMTFSPVLQMSHRLLTALLCHCKSLFPDVVIHRYVPPLSSGSSFPESPKEMLAELKKQESLLNQLHKEMNAGYVSTKKEEQLWEIQRIITQLKRKLKCFQKSQDVGDRKKSLEQEEEIRVSVIVDEEEQEQTKSKSSDDSKSRLSPSSLEQDSGSSCNDTMVPNETETQNKKAVTAAVTQENEQSPEKSVASKTEEVEEDEATDDSDNNPSEEFTRVLKEELLLQLEHEHLLRLQNKLQGRIENERLLVEKLKSDIALYNDFSEYVPNSSDEDEKDGISEEELQMIEHYMTENQKLEQKKNDLVKMIIAEQEACVKLRVQISFLDVMKSTG